VSRSSAAEYWKDQAMTPTQFREAMQRLADGEDQERDHADADALMASILERLGYGEGVAIYRELAKWYS
jgi:hypothetical protein